MNKFSLTYGHSASIRSHFLGSLASAVICVSLHASFAAVESKDNVPAQISSTQATGAQSCGAVALAELAHALHTPPEVEEKILNTAAPQGGFSLAELRKLAARFGMVLEIVRRPAQAEIPVPSIVHWKIGHYGVIAERKGPSYRIGDAGSREIWMDVRQLEANASGIFLVPAGNEPMLWQRLTEAESAALRGGHLCIEPCTVNIPDDDEDPPTDCCDDNDDQDASCDPPSANDGASSSGDNPPPPPCCCDMGMPRWHVSGYVNLWLIDRPLLYKTTNNKWFPLKITYKSSGPNRGTNNGGFGPKWECNWLGMLQSVAGSANFTNFHSGGGIRQMPSMFCSGDACAEYSTAETIAMPPGNPPVVTNPRGGGNQYGYAVGDGLGNTNFYMDKRTDRYGRTVQYNYETVSNCTRLKTVRDVDGHVSQLAYDNATFPQLVSSVTDPYSHTAHFYYNTNGMLTNIVDAAGMSSVFAYDTNGFITSMTTAYGATAFTYYSDTNTDRAILVTEASGEHQLYAFVASSVAPSTYHWNRSQYDAISDDGKTNYLAMLPEDYGKAEVQQWLFYARTDSEPLVVSDTVALSAAPVDPLLGISPGTLTFTYMGQTNSGYTGTLKRLTSISRDGVPLAGMARNSLGRPLFVTNYNGDGSMAVITNTFDGSGRYLKKQSGSHGELVRGYGYHAVITNLLVSVMNAVGDITRYTHDTNTMKVTSITFPSGLVRTNEYSSGFLIKQTDQGIRTNAFTYSNGNVASQTDELGLVTTRGYDALNRLQQITFPDGTTISNLYDKLDLIGVKDRLGHWTRYTHTIRCGSLSAKPMRMAR